ncbi:MAG: HAMP domain-containing histidine kinase [Taibaiella sp.]|nr:HAMP domain-containing histidine kinase [Taibaiella sp.]
MDDEAAQGYRDGQFYFAMIAQAGDRNMVYLTISEHQVAERIEAYMKRVSFLAVISIVLFSVITYFYLSRSVFKPISTISEKVRQISAENLHLRLELPENNIELLKLATTFNDMINRLETSFETQNNFISNASHELRTPLTAIMGVSEVCLSKERSREEYIETIQVIMEEAEKLDSKTQALLMLAQTGFDGKAQKFEIIRLDELLWEVKSTVDKLNRDNKVVFDLDLLPDNPYKLKVSGNAQMLHLAFTNLILNGCKYSDNDIVIISVGVTESSIVVIIKDQGIGIPSNEIQYIYDPFFRASNTSAYKGYGIGLPLARNIIIMHKGTLDVQSVNQKGVTVKVKLPLAFPAR